MEKSKITSSSTAEYFAKNLQQVGFSSPTKAVLTTLKEGVDNSLDACDEAGILPDVSVEVEKKGTGTIRNTDLIRVVIDDNGPGLEVEELARVYGEYLASSKFGRGRCSRGQQGIGISAATTWAQLTSARGALVTSKTKRMKKAVRVTVEVDIKNNKGILKNKEAIDWDRPHGNRVEFLVDGRIQMQGEGGLLTYLLGTTLVNPHLSLKYKMPEMELVSIPRVSNVCPVIPPATEPHPHTMKLGEFIAHSHLFGRVTLKAWLKKGFSRVTDNVIQLFLKNGLKKEYLDQSVSSLKEPQFKDVFSVIQKTELMSPSTKSVMMIGEEAFAKSIRRLGEVDFFSVVTRKPTICDAKPIVVEAAVARLKKGQAGQGEDEGPVTVLRFANRVPLQFDKSSCAIFKAIQTVNWRTYGLNQPKGNIPAGPYIVAVSVVSPFIKFKNASKETVDASEELVEEMRRALIQAGQRLSRHIKKEHREADLERKLQHIEQFCPILVDCLCRIIKAPKLRKVRAVEGLIKILGRDVNEAKRELKASEKELAEAKKQGGLYGTKSSKDDDEPSYRSEQQELPLEENGEATAEPTAPARGKAVKKPAPKKRQTKGKRVIQLQPVNEELEVNP